MLNMVLKSIFPPLVLSTFTFYNIRVATKTICPLVLEIFSFFHFRSTLAPFFAGNAISHHSDLTKWPSNDHEKGLFWRYKAESSTKCLSLMQTWPCHFWHDDLTWHPMQSSDFASTSVSGHSEVLFAQSSPQEEKTAVLPQNNPSDLWISPTTASRLLSHSHRLVLEAEKEGVKIVKEALAKLLSDDKIRQQDPKPDLLKKHGMIPMFTSTIKLFAAFRAQVDGRQQESQSS